MSSASGHIRVLKRELLRDPAAEREPEEIDFGQVKRAAKLDAAPRHLCDGRRRLTARSGDVGAVERDDFTVGRKTIRQLRIPVIHIRSPVIGKEQWTSPTAAEAAGTLIGLVRPGRTAWEQSRASHWISAWSRHLSRLVIAAVWIRFLSISESIHRRGKRAFQLRYSSVSRRSMGDGLAGIAARTLQRWKNGNGLAPTGRCHPVQPHALSEAERARIIAVANEPRFAAPPTARIIPVLADEGVASESCTPTTPGRDVP